MQQGMSLGSIPKRVDVIGVPISSTNMENCLSIIVDGLDTIRGEYICVSNVHTTVMAHDNPDYFEVQANSIMSVPDGKPLSVIGRKTCPEMDRVTGPDLMRELFNDPIACKKRHFFYGNTAENLQIFVDQMRREYPELVISGYEPSVFRPMNDSEELDLASRINATHADYVWVALGAPRQEELCFRLKGKVNALMVGVGGAFNVLAGITPEAPRWVQDLSLEWLYRLMQEPSRLFKRYAVTNSKFIYYLVTKTPPKRC